MAQAPRQYYGTIPNIAQAYQNDPRTLLANSALATGTSTAPVAAGNWGYADGIARAAQAITGAFMDKKTRGRYAEREGKYMDAMSEAAKAAGTPQADPAMAAAATALAPPQQPPPQPQPSAVPNPVQTFTPPPSAPPPPDPRVMAGGPDPLAPLPAQGPQGPQGAPMQPAAMPRPPQAAQPRSSQLWSQTAAPPRQEPPPRPTNAVASRGSGMTARDMYYAAIVPQEGGMNADGSFNVSWKDAVGPAQMIPSTARAVAKQHGILFDDEKYRSDADYNNMLGELHYEDLLNKYDGDPLKAAAAYNAGEQAVNRALRKERRTGERWTAFLPVTYGPDGKTVVDTTEEYVQRFSDAIGSGGTTTERGYEAMEDVQAPPRQGVAPPQMEQAPALPAMDQQRPNAPQLPSEVQSNRIAMAQQMLASGNPDLAMLAQDYLDKGLTEQNAARILRAEQQFMRDNATYGAELGDFFDQRSADRQYRYNENSASNQRNFQREENYNDRQFQAGENYAQRQLTSRIASQDRAWQTERDEAAHRRALELEGVRARSGGKDAFWSTATGEKLRGEMEDANNGYYDLIEKIDNFLFMNQNTATGGLRALTGGVEATLGNDDLGSMRGIGNQVTIDALGGLGIAISDGDRQYVDKSYLSISDPYEQNLRRGEIAKAIAQRNIDYNVSKLDWRAQYDPRSMSQFGKLWREYVNSVSIVTRDEESGEIRADRNAPDFTDWLASRPKYDADGNEVK